MAHFSIDRDGVRGARAVLADDPATLHQLAAEVASATAAARAGLGGEWPGLLEALERFRTVHAFALDAIAGATAALGGDLDLVVTRSAHVEMAVAAALGSIEVAVGRG